MDLWSGSGLQFISGLQKYLGAFTSVLGNLVLFIIILGVLIFVHELGHFLAAKLNGVRVKEFALGFGPALWKKQGKETLYSIRIIPFGGFNKLAGMEAPESIDDELEIDETEIDEKAFFRKSVPRRMSILFAGPFMNLVLAISLNALIYAFLPVILLNIIPGSPAEIGGLLPEDELVSIEGVSINNSQDAVSVIQESTGKPLEFVVNRSGKKQTLYITPELNPETGIPIIGVEMSGGRLGIVQSLRAAFLQTWFTIQQLVGELTKVIRGLVKPDFAGPIGLYQLTGEVARGGIWRIISFTVLLSINLAVINLIPIPMLDGGGLLILLIEGIRRKPLSVHSKSLAQLVGLGFMILLLIFATMQDISRLSL